MKLSSKKEAFHLQIDRKRTGNQLTRWVDIRPNEPLQNQKAGPGPSHVVVPNPNREPVVDRSLNLAAARDRDPNAETVEIGILNAADRDHTLDLLEDLGLDLEDTDGDDTIAGVAGEDLDHIAAQDHHRLITVV